MLKIDALHIPLVNTGPLHAFLLSSQKKFFILFYFPLSIRSNDIQLKMFIFVVVKYVLYNNNEYAVRTC